MRRISSLIILLSFLVPVAPASENLEAVREARALLELEKWSRVLEIDNSGDTSLYPKTTYALVFEFNGILWIYTPHDGTQSLSLHANHLERDKTDLRPLLKEIHPGFARYTELPESGAGRHSAEDVLPNGCFVESLASARALSGSGHRILRAGLLLYYSKGGPQSGHTVLAYETESGVFIADGLRQAPQKLKGKWSDKPLDLARRHEPSLRGHLSDARFVPIPVDGDRTRQMASTQGTAARERNG